MPTAVSGITTESQQEQQQPGSSASNPTEIKHFYRKNFNGTSMGQSLWSMALLPLPFSPLMIGAMQMA